MSTEDKNKNPEFWQNKASSLGRIVWYALHELCLGIANETIDVSRYVYPGIFLGLILVSHIDSWLGAITGWEWIRLSDPLREFLVITSILSGWIIWAVEKAIARVHVLSRLKSAFLDSGLVSLGKLPSLIEDIPVDEHVRKMKLLVKGIPLSKFKEKKHILESHLFVSIVRIYEESNDKSRINLVYATESLTNQAILEDTESFRGGDVPIGVTYDGAIKVNLRDVGHILVSGQTGGGKSNFLKVATTALVANDPQSEVHFLDFKGGMELADLINQLGKDQPNFFHQEGPSKCIKYLASLRENIESRLQEIAGSGSSSLDEYLEKTSVNQTDGSDEAEKSERLSRIYLIIDEIAQLYARDPGIPKEELLNARDAVNRIARQGRAAGVHLIVATQKPDSSSFDQTVKANLPAILCFPMVSQVASVSAIGTKRAFDLDPEIKGRAVWKFGPHLKEVQTYVFQ